MGKRIKWFCGSILLFPVLLGLWILVGFLFVLVPFIAFVNPDIFDKKEDV